MGTALELQHMELDRNSVASGSVFRQIKQNPVRNDGKKLLNLLTPFCSGIYILGQPLAKSQFCYLCLILMKNSVSTVLWLFLLQSFLLYCGQHATLAKSQQWAQSRSYLLVFEGCLQCPAPGLLSFLRLAS